MKQTFKKFYKQYILNKLEGRVKQFFINNPHVKLVVVVGSVGKTSTKQAIATMLSQKLRVIASPEGYNTPLSVPLAILGIPLPEDVFSFSVWRKVLAAAKERSKKDRLLAHVVVVELGADRPGDILHYASFLKPDLAVITAVAPEHMEYFETIDAVAKEELSVGSFSKAILVNRDDVSEAFAPLLQAQDIDTYGLSGVAEYHFLVNGMSENGEVKGTLVSLNTEQQQVQLKVVGEHSVKPLVAAAATAARFGFTPADIKNGIEAIQPVTGRMQPLQGLKNSLLLDDTYNASPLACIAALQTIYALPRQQRIAVFGSMNEMGNYSKTAHEQVAFACDPSMLEWVVTIGQDAEKYLAAAAQGRGCQVKSFKSPIDAGAFVHSVIRPEAVVLFKGSQDGVFAEEAVKILLEHSSDEDRLVRQSPEWMKVKSNFLSKF